MIQRRFLEATRTKRCSPIVTVSRGQIIAIVAVHSLGSSLPWPYLAIPFARLPYYCAREGRMTEGVRHTELLKLCLGRCNLMIQLSRTWPRVPSTMNDAFDGFKCERHAITIRLSSLSGYAIQHDATCAIMQSVRDIPSIPRVQDVVMVFYRDLGNGH